MDFGDVISSSWSAKQIVESARVVDEHGLDFLLLTDHYMTPHSNESVDAWIALAALATKTERIRLGTCVTPIPFRPPQMLAKIVATVDQLFNGRVILGVGAGWHKPEFDAYSSWHEDRVRVAKTREGIQLIMKLWTSNEPFDFEGKHYRVKSAILEPKPVQQPHPPLWFGTTGAYMLRLAKQYADGSVPPRARRVYGSLSVRPHSVEGRFAKEKSERNQGNVQRDPRRDNKNGSQACRDGF